MGSWLNRLVFTLLLIVYLSIPAITQAADRPNALTNVGTPLKLALEKDYPPFLYVEDSTIKGISYEYTQLIAKKLNRQLTTTEPLQLQAMLDAVKNGDANLLADITKTSEREQFLAFSDPYIKTPATVIGRKDKSSQWDQTGSNTGRKIAVGKGYGVVSYLKQKYPDATLIEVASDDEVTRAVAFGAAEVGVLDTGSLSYLAQKNPLSNIEVIADTEFSYALSFAVNRADASYIPAINQAISEITAAERAAIFQQWQETIPRRSSAPTISIQMIIISVIALTLVTLIIMAWIISLRRAIHRKTTEISQANALLDKKIDANIVRSEKLEQKALAETAKLNDAQKAMLNILEDIDAEKKYSEELSNRFKASTRAANIGVWEWDIIRDKAEANDIFYRHHELSPDTTQSQAFTTFFATINPEDRAKNQQILQKALANDNDFELEFHFITQQGIKKTYRIIGTIVRNAAGQPIKAFGIERDVTREEEIDRQKTEFVSLASHQLRTPLTSIRWNTELLLDDAGLTEKQKKYAQEIYDGNIRMIELVNSLLNVSRLEMNTFTSELSDVDMRKVVSDVRKDIVELARNHHVEVLEEYGEHLTPYRCDDKIMKILVLNLLTNAIKYSPEGGKAKIAINIQPKGTNIDQHTLDTDSLIIAVSDNGIGIPENQKDKIFTKMFRADNARNLVSDGTGLGLYLVKEIVEKNHGQAWFTTKLNEGTTFYLALPASGMVSREGTSKLNPLG